MTTWRALISEQMARHNESFDDYVASATGERLCGYQRVEAADNVSWLDEEFDNGYGCPEGRAFTLWTARRVYFPVCYDGAEDVGSVPRDPCDEPSDHVGGW